jgi:hypothetical protein
MQWKASGSRAAFGRRLSATSTRFLCLIGLLAKKPSGNSLRHQRWFFAYALIGFVRSEVS